MEKNARIEIDLLQSRALFADKRAVEQVHIDIDLLERPCQSKDRSRVLVCKGFGYLWLTLDGQSKHFLFSGSFKSEVKILNGGRERRVGSHG